MEMNRCVLSFKKIFSSLKSMIGNVRFGKTQHTPMKHMQSIIEIESTCCGVMCDALESDSNGANFHLNHLLSANLDAMQL